MGRSLAAALWVSAVLLSASSADGPVYGDPIVWVNFETETPGTHRLPGEWQSPDAEGVTEVLTDGGAPEGKAYLRLSATTSPEGNAVFAVPTDLRPGAMLRIAASIRAESLPEGAAVWSEMMVGDVTEATKAVRIACGEPAIGDGVWHRAEADLSALRGAGAGYHITAYQLAVRGAPPATRVAFDVDSILIEGDYNDYFETAWGLHLRNYQEEGRARLSELTSRVEALVARDTSVPAGLPAHLAALLSANGAWLTEECAALADETARLAAAETLTRPAVDGLAGRVADAESVAAQRGQAVAIGAAVPYPVWQMPLASSVPCPDAPVAAGRLVSELSVAAAAGETRRLVVALRPDSDLSGVSLRFSGLRNADGGTVLDPSAWDVAHVLAWEQAVEPLTDAGYRDVPELVAHDPDLLASVLRDPPGPRAGVATRVRTSELPADSARLRPCAVAAGEVHAFAVALSVPPGLTPGQYRGEALLGSARLPVSVEVLPITPPQSPYDLVVDLGAKLSGESKGTATLVDERRMREMLRDVRDRGATGLVLREDMPVRGRTADLAPARRLIEMATEEGLRPDPIILRGSEDLFLETTVRGRDPVSRAPYLSALTSAAADCAALRDELGCGAIALSALAGGSEDVQLLGNTPAGACEEVGTPVFTEGDLGICRRIAHRRFVAAQAMDRRDVLSARQKGSRLWFDVASAGMERPAELRWAAGFGAVGAGADGVLLRYWQAYGNPLDDGDLPFKDSMMTYPAADGVIPTLGWYAVDEAVWDVRYLAALDGLIAEARARSGRGGFGGRTPEAILQAHEARNAALRSGDAEASRAALVDAYRGLAAWLAASEVEAATR